MKMTFLGAAHEVTGSCTYLEVGDKKGLVDYGMEQGKDLFENEPIPVPPSELDFVLLTHAHIDHAGLLPLLFKQGFRGSVYTSSATVQLCDIMLRDSANIQIQEAEWQNRRAKRSGGDPVEPLYGLEDVDGIMARMIPCPYDKIVQVNDCVSIRLTDVGHLLGSAAIEIWLHEDGQERKICFSGDIGNRDQPILRDPMFVSDAQYLVIESTYGDRLHSETRVDYVTELARRIQETLDRGGNVIIPSFAVGRTQEMLYFLREIKERELVKGHGAFPVYVDSPLAVEATGIFLQCDTSFLDEEAQELMRAGVNPIWFEGLELSVSKNDSQAINENPTPKVILSASGMCDAGRVRHHLKHNLWRPESSVLFVGYQAEGTLGRLLIDGVKSVKLFDELIEVNASIDVLPGVSGHADKQGLLDWLQGFERKPELVFVNHGDPEVADSFAACLEQEYGYRAYAPYSGTCFDLLRGEFDVETEGRAIERRAAASTKAARLYGELVAAGERLLKLCRAAEGRPNKDLSRWAKEILKLADILEK
ncbi:MAG: MBL fold metallo-hydrolase [Oscillospiraceae bacterium]|nr:MBL fold metallo-hydrolase [Oscillospiraceae bacterium]